MELDDLQREDLERAADELDALWRLLEGVGDRDGLGGAEYNVRSVAPLIRSIAKDGDSR